MFKKNIDHTQADIFGLYNTLHDNTKKKVEKSEQYTFYKLIFYNIKEALFSKLYSDKKSTHTRLKLLLLYFSSNYWGSVENRLVVFSTGAGSLSKE